ncbi:RDD family protein [candidate division KSB1 bacterium]|nr:RDD family protein [candidate division KSB1 bacterium]
MHNMTNQNTSYAGFWRRFAANIIDSVIVFHILSEFYFTLVSQTRMILLKTAGSNRELLHKLLEIFPFWEDLNYYLMTSEQVGSDTHNMAHLLAIRIALIFFLTPLPFIFSWCYFSGLESSPLRATPGKLALGIYVADMEGKRISFGRATARHFSKIVSNMTMNVGYLMAGFSMKKQALHDMVASCLILKK